MAIHSDWGDWLPQAVADADPTGLACWYLGCNGFILKSSGGTTVCIDPYLGTGNPPRTVRMIPVPFDPNDLSGVDAVLATHEHADHVHGPSQAPLLSGTDATYYAPDASLDVVAEEGWTERWDVDPTQFQEVSEGERFVVGDLTVTVGPADDPDAIHPVAFVIEHESGTFAHGGDARAGGFGDLATHDIDVGVLAFGTSGIIPDKQTQEPTRTTWYNDETALVEAANELELECLIPTHWDMWKGLTADPTALYDHIRSFPYPNRLELLEIGDRLDLPI